MVWITPSTHFTMLIDTVLTAHIRYVDGEIVRTGPEGDHGDGAYSGGRGGAGNIGSPGLAPTQRKDADAIPEAALRPSTDNQNYHTGRGGGGNVHVAEATEKKQGGGLADKLKNKLFKKKTDTADASTETTGAK